MEHIASMRPITGRSVHEAKPILETGMPASGYRLRRSQFVARPPHEVFAFFSEASNLERITPRFLKFQILAASSASVSEGALIDYRLRLWGVALRWQSRIECFQPPRQFVDVQVRGPYRRWRHTHSFDEVPGGTRIADEVHYELPLGPLGVLAHALFVGRMLRKIFDYREAAIAEIFPTTSARLSS